MVRGKAVDGMDGELSFLMDSLIVGHQKGLFCVTLEAFSGKCWIDASSWGFRNWTWQRVKGRFSGEDPSFVWLKHLQGAAWKQVQVRICIYTCIHICVFIYVSVSIPLSIYIYLKIYICIYISQVSLLQTLHNPLLCWSKFSDLLLNWYSLSTYWVVPKFLENF